MVRLDRPRRDGVNQSFDFQAVSRWLALGVQSKLDEFRDQHELQAIAERLVERASLGGFDRRAEVWAPTADDLSDSIHHWIRHARRVRAITVITTPRALTTTFAVAPT